MTALELVPRDKAGFALSENVLDDLFSLDFILHAQKDGDSFGFLILTVGNHLLGHEPGLAQPLLGTHRQQTLLQLAPQAPLGAAHRRRRHLAGANPSSPHGALSSGPGEGPGEGPGSAARGPRFRVAGRTPPPALGPDFLAAFAVSSRPSPSESGTAEWAPASLLLAGSAAVMTVRLASLGL